MTCRGGCWHVIGLFVPHIPIKRTEVNDQEELHRSALLLTLKE